METPHPTQHDPIGRAALKFYAACAAVVYSFALYYCYSTKHFMELGMITVMCVVLTGFVMYSYRKL